MPEDEIDNEPSVDDILEESRDRRIGETFDQEKLAEDNDSPAAPADNPFELPLPPDHPLLDIDADPDEIYEEGETGSLEAQGIDSEAERRNILRELTEDEERM